VQGSPQNALAEIELVRYDPARAFLYAVAYYPLGRQKEVDAALSELIAKYHARSAYDIAQVYAFRKQSNEAFKWLEQAYAQRDSGLIGTNVDPLLKNLHNDPRFCRVLEKNPPTELTFRTGKSSWCQQSTEWSGLVFCHGLLPVPSPVTDRNFGEIECKRGDRVAVRWSFKCGI